MQGRLTLMQGQSIVVFTVVTIIFVGRPANSPGFSSVS